MDKPLIHHIAEVKQKILLFEAAREDERNETRRSEWAAAVRNLQLALAHYELAYQLEQETRVPTLAATAGGSGA